MIGSINKALLQEMFHLPKQFEILLVIALGKPGGDRGPGGS